VDVDVSITQHGGGIIISKTLFRSSISGFNKPVNSHTPIVFRFFLLSFRHKTHSFFQNRQPFFLSCEFRPPSSVLICGVLVEIRSRQAACSEASPRLFSAWFARVVSRIYSPLAVIDNSMCFCTFSSCSRYRSLIMGMPCVIYSFIVHNGLRFEGRFKYKIPRDRVLLKLEFK
jgi:hypothetical protein